MAACSHLQSVLNATAGPFTTPAFTPAAGDLLFGWGAGIATTDNVPTMSDTQGLGWTRILVATHGASSDRRLYFFIANALAGAVSTTATLTIASTSGGALAVGKVTLMSRTGAAAIRQSAKQDSQAASSTPAPAFGVAALTGNPTLGAVGNFSNPASMTPPASWTEQLDVGGAGNTPGLEYVTRDSGFTGTTVTWGGTSLSTYGDIIIELDTSAAPLLARARLYLQGVNRASTF